MERKRKATEERLEAEREAHRLFSTKFDMMTAGSTWGIITDGDDASAALGTPSVGGGGDGGSADGAEASPGRPRARPHQALCP